MNKLFKAGLLGLAIATVLIGTSAFTTSSSVKKNNVIVKQDPVYEWFNNPSFSGSPIDANTVTDELARLQAANPTLTFNTTGGMGFTAIEFGTDGGADPNVTIFEN